MCPKHKIINRVNTYVHVVFIITRQQVSTAFILKIYLFFFTFLYFSLRAFLDVYC